MTKNDFVIMVLSVAAQKKKLDFTFVNRLTAEIKQKGIDIGDALKTPALFEENPPRQAFMESAGALVEECEMYLENLSKRKIEIFSTENPYYPENLKLRLGEKTPPCFFSVGNICLAAKESVAVTGVRGVYEEDERFALRVGKLCAEEKLVVVSGGAVGVDSIALGAALSNGGEAVVYLPQGFEKSRFMQVNRKYIEGGTLLGLSVCAPEQHFAKNSALERNIFIHTHGDITLTVRAKYKSGGSWSGAYRNLQRGRTPAFVSDIPSPGNEALAEMGAHVLKREELHGKDFKLREEIKRLKG